MAKSCIAQWGSSRAFYFYSFWETLFRVLGRTYFPRGSACNPFSWLVQLANWALFHM